MTEKDAIEVIRQARAIAGRKYKSAIGAAWMNGNYREHGLENLSGALQSVRNEFGPTWLHCLRVPSLVPVYDYTLQVWVIGGVIQNCAHPESMHCGCNARRFAGQTIAAALEGFGAPAKQGATVRGKVREGIALEGQEFKAGKIYKRIGNAFVQASYDPEWPKFGVFGSPRVAPDGASVWKDTLAEALAALDALASEGGA